MKSRNIINLSGTKNILKGLYINLKSATLILGLIWTIIISTSLIYNLQEVVRNNIKTIDIQANISLEKDNLLRSWAANHGGVYVPVTESTQPNPILAHVPERDITTSSGKLLTLMNPAYMLRQLYEFELQNSRISSHITSLNPIRLENAPDQWEKKALQSFEHGIEEVAGIDTIDGVEYYRLIRPLKMEEGCLKCHPQKDNESVIRGGYGITLPMQTYSVMLMNSKHRLILIHTLVWLIGLLGLVVWYILLSRSINKRKASEAELLKLNNELEDRVKERTVEVENALNQNKSILESAGEGIYGLDLEGNSTFVNQAAAELLGYTKEELLGIQMHANHHHHKADGSEYLRIECPIYSSFTDGISKKISDEVFWKKDGTPFFVEYASTPVYKDGTLTGAVVVFKDITKRRKNLEDITNERNKAEQYFEIAGIMLVILDKVGIVTKVNAKGCEVLGYPANKIIGKNWFDTFVPDNMKEAISQIYEEIMKGENTAAEFYENPIVNRNGEERLIEWHNVILKDNDGNPVGTLSSGEDITMRNKAQEEIRNANRIYTVLSNINQMIVRTNNKQNIFDEACLIALEDGKFKMAWIGILDEQSKKVIPISDAGFTDDYLSKLNIDLSDEKLSLGPVGRAVRTGVHFIANDIANNSDMILWRSKAQKYGFKSAAAFPLSTHGETIGAFILYSDEEFFFDNTEVKLLDELAMDISYALEFIENESARKKTEDEIRESEKRYRTLADNSPMGILVHDNGTPLYTNYTARRIFEVEPDADLSKVNAYDLIHPSSKDKVSELMKEILASGKAHPLTVLKFITMNGKEIELEITSLPIRYGNINALQAMFNDITESKKAEAEMNKLAEIVKHSHELVNLATLDGNMIFLNDFGCKMLGIEPNVVSSVNIMDVIPDNFKGIVETELLPMIMKGEAWEGDLQYRNLKTGKLTSVHAMAFTINNQDTGKPQFLANVSFDITKNKLAEEKIRNLNAELEIKVEQRTKELKNANSNLIKENEERKRAEKLSRQSENLRQLQFVNSPIGMLLCKMDGTFVDINPACAEIIGRSPEESLKLTYWDLTPEKYAQQETEQLESLEKTGRYGPYIKEYIHKDGHLVPVELSGLILTINDEQYIWSSVQDITQRKLAVDEIKKAKNEAERANLAKSEFLANMSHEIRTPLNAVLGYSEILSRMVDEPIQIDYLNSIRTSGKTLMSLINDILDLSKIESGKLSIQDDEVNLPVLLSEVQTSFIQKAINKGIDFTINIPDDFPKYVILDELRVKQILLNLTGNAIKFTEKGFINLSLKIDRIGKAKIDFELSVNDSGIGVSEGFKKRIFGAFEQQQGQDNRKYGGTGLGLAITHRIVTLLGAKITLKSQVDKGSQFIIKFKNVPIIDETTVTKIKEKQLNPDLVKFFSPNILVVDDIPDNRKLIKGYLLPYAVHVVDAENGLEAINKMKENPPDFVFMDLRMPVMGGEDAVKVIRSNPETASIPVVALTASAFRSKEEEIKQSGFNGYVRKPASLQDIVEAMVRFLPHEIDDEQDSVSIETSSSILLSPELFSEIERKIMPLVSDLQNIRPKKKVVVLAETLIGLGEKYNNQDVLKYGNELLTANANFNVEKEKDLIIKLPKVFINKK